MFQIRFRFRRICILLALFSACAETQSLAQSPALSQTPAQKQDALQERYIEKLEKTARDYSNRRSWKNAQEIYGEILQKRQKQWGRDDIRLIGPLNDVVRVTCVDGKCANTVPFLNDLLAIRLKKFGKWNADVATTYALIAEANEKMQRYPEALKNFKEVILIRDKVFGKTSAMAIRTRFNVIRVALKAKNKALAKETHLECRTLLTAGRHPQPELEKLLSYYSSKI